MSRIEGVPETTRNPILRAIFGFARRTFHGRLPEPLRVTAHHPRILLGWSAMEQGLAWSRRVDPVIKDLASMKAAMMVGCPW
jgi:hypothetical protein